MGPVAKYHTGVRRMTHTPYGPNRLKYSAVYACSMKRLCLARERIPARTASGRITRCIRNSRVKLSTTM